MVASTSSTRHSIPCSLRPKPLPNACSCSCKACSLLSVSLCVVLVFIFAIDTLTVLAEQSSARDRRAAVAQAVMRRIGLQLIAGKKAAILAETRGAGHGVEKKDVSGRDLLTLLIKANMAVDVPENQRLTDEEVLARMLFFAASYHNTTNGSLQRSLRERPAKATD